MQRSRDEVSPPQDSLPLVHSHASDVGNRLLKTAEAAAYVGLAASTLEKRRVTGLDSPPYIQSVARGVVRYRVRDLDAWLNARTFRNTSER